MQGQHKLLLPGPVCMSRSAGEITDGNNRLGHARNTSTAGDPLESGKIGIMDTSVT